MRARSIIALASSGVLLASAVARAEPAEARGAATASHPTLSGLVGGVHVVDASAGEPGTFRVSLAAGYFGKNGFLAPDDRQRATALRLGLSVTPVEHLELAALLVSRASQSRATEPEVVQVMGDVHLLAKGYGALAPWLTLGGDVSLALLNGLGRIGVSGRASTVGLRASATADLRELTRPLPLRLRANVRYLFDNSAKLARETEAARYAALPNPAGDDEYRHLLSASERFALDVYRVDRMGASVGVELPLAPHERVLVSPLLEWGFALPVNRQGYDCTIARLGGGDGCLADEGFAARPSRVTLGARIEPYLPGLALLLAADIATSGHRRTVRELAPEPRYFLFAALSYAYDPRPPPAAPACPAPVEPELATARGHIVGQVVESQTGIPISGAIVHFEDTDHSDVVSAQQGRFRSAELGPGAQGMRIRAPGYEEALCVAVLPTSGADAPVRCELSREARAAGSVRGTVTDLRGDAIAGARVSLSGPLELALTSDGEGAFALAEVPVGRYALRVEAAGYFPAHAELEVAPGDALALPPLALALRPQRPLAVLARKRILLRRPLRFEGQSASLSAESVPLVLEVAELLQAHREITELEIGAHVDATGSASAARALTEQRAEAVRALLIAQGVAPARLRAVGFGGTRPLVPNITAQNRARNRRIELVIR